MDTQRVDRQKVLVILNPASGQRRAETRRERVEARLREAGVDFEVRETQGEGDAHRWAKEATDTDLVIAFGGDGTIMEAMSGLIANPASIPLAQLPAGTANLLARALGIPVDLDEALDVALGGVAVHHDVGYLPARDRYFALVAGAGYDAQLIEDAPRTLKNRIGFFAYVLSGISNLFRQRRSRIHLQVDGETHSFTAHTVMAINVGEIEGMHLRIAEHIDPHDGKLNLAILVPTSLWGIARLLVRLATGNLEGYREFQFFEADRMKLEADPPLEVQIDGEAIGTTPLEVEAVPDGALFVVPAVYAEERELERIEVRARHVREAVLDEKA